MKLHLLHTLTASVLLLGAAGIGAQAQTTTPATGYSVTYGTDNNGALKASNETGTPKLGTGAYISNFGRGVGYSTTGYSDTFSQSTSTSTAQSLFQPFTYRGQTLSASDPFQLAIHSDAINETVARPTQTILASIFTYSASQATAGNAPIGTTVVSNIPIVLAAHDNDAGFTNDFIYYSAITSLTSGLTAGQNYVIGFTSATSPDNFVLVDSVAPSRSGLSTADKTFATNVYETDNNSGLTGGPAVTENGILAFRILTPAAAPEPSQFVALGLGALSLAGLALRRRRMA